MAAFHPFASSLFEDSLKQSDIWSRRSAADPVTQSPGMAEFDRLVDQWTRDSDRPLATSGVSASALNNGSDHDLYTSAIRSLNLNQQPITSLTANEMNGRISQAQWTTGPRNGRESAYPAVNFRPSAHRPHQQTHRPANQRQHHAYHQSFQSPLQQQFNQQSHQRQQQFGRPLLPQPPVESMGRFRRMAPISSSSVYNEPLIDLAVGPLLRQIRGSAVNQVPLDRSYDLTYQVDRCLEQLKMMEKERRKAEQSLSQLFPGHKVSGNNSIPVPKLQPKPTRVDRLIVDQVKEHAKIFTLISLMEQLSAEHPDGLMSPIHHWLEAQRHLQNVRQEEMVADANDASGKSEYSATSTAVSLAVKQLCATTRTARTTFWAIYIRVVERESANRLTGQEPALDSGPGLSARGEVLTHVSLFPAV